MVGVPGISPTLLILVTICIHGVLLQSPPRTGEQRKPFFERFRRLEEQFRRFQEVTLMRLQEIAGNYNISYNIDARFEHLLSRHGTLESAANETHAATAEELDHLKTWMRKLQNKTKKIDLRVVALEESSREKIRESSAEKQQQSALLSSLTQEASDHKEDAQALRASQATLQKALESLQDALKSQGTKLDQLEQLLKSPVQNEVLLPAPLAAAHLLSQPPQEKAPEAAGGQNPTRKKLRVKHQQGKKLQQESSRLVAQSQRRGLQSGSLPGQMVPQQETGPETGPSPPEPQALRQQHSVMDKASEEQEGAQVPRKPGTICNVGAMLVFPNASTENFATFKPGFPTGLLELSLCSWVSTNASYLGTILSYATEENDNKLVLHGRDAAPRNAIHFVIGDPAFRELPVGRLLDGRWHHMCVIWSSIQGRYWFYVDRRLASMGSRFQKGYEIPPRGSLILGQEQDTIGGGFETSEAFVGLLAGFAVWDRALSPGEVSGIATGKGLPRGPVLTLANISVLNGSVQKVDCTCLEHCL
ncbi:pentraxin-4 [Hemicordylus capensis]|uniref:pentraxin-4 n=1 Tax=Hemicordylus capensis TaxID=884348 RepID=UPI002302664B|nr:pentraxin-4 [Hemicordylus capensis]